MICGILLAAGSSVRFGSPKLLQALDEKNSIAQRSALHLQQAIANLLVVVRPDDARLIQQMQDINIPYVLCSQATNGMSASIACGIKHSMDASGWIIALADMPLVQTSTIRQIAQALESNSIVAPYYHGQRGNPVGFSAQYRQALLNLEGDKGARDLLTTNEDHIYRIITEDAGVVQDIDTADDMMKHLSPRD